jgi:hypothetical protein
MDLRQAQAPTDRLAISLRVKPWFARAVAIGKERLRAHEAGDGAQGPGTQRHQQLAHAGLEVPYSTRCNAILTAEQQYLCEEMPGAFD